MIVIIIMSKNKNKLEGDGSHLRCLALQGTMLHMTTRVLGGAGFFWQGPAKTGEEKAELRAGEVTGDFHGILLQKKVAFYQVVLQV